jgi:hypothetical protein
MQLVTSSGREPAKLRRGESRSLMILDAYLNFFAKTCTTALTSIGDLSDELRKHLAASSGFVRSSKVARLHVFRNRLAHHQRVWSHAPDERYEDLLALAGYIDSALPGWIAARQVSPMSTDFKETSQNPLQTVVEPSRPGARGRWPSRWARAAPTCPASRPTTGHPPKHHPAATRRSRRGSAPAR